MRRSMGSAPNLAAMAACLCLHALVVSADSDVQSSDEMTLEWKQIFVNILDGPSSSMMIEPDETGADLRLDIYEVERIPYSPMTLTVGDTLVEFSNRLSDYNISEGTILTVNISDHLGREPVGFYVRTLDGRKLQVITALGNSVASLKDNITQWTGIPQIEQRLLCNGKELRDERKLLHYRIETQTVLTLGRPLEECRQVATIFVNTLSGATFGVEVDLADTVSNLKEKIYGKTGIPTNVQRLSSNRRMISGVDHLCDLGIEAGSTVYMYLYSARVTSSDQIARLREPLAADLADPYRAPIFRESEDEVQSSRDPLASLYKDARNWLIRTGHRPFFANDLFDQVAHLSPNPDYDASIQSYHNTLETLSRPNASARERRDAVTYRARLNLVMPVRLYREAANLTSANYTDRSPGITLGGGFSNVGPDQLISLGADVNNWAPDAFTDSDLMRLFEVAERVRQVLARAAQTGKGILSIATQRQINLGILMTYHQVLAGYQPSVDYNPVGEDEECVICRDDLKAEPAVKLACGHAFHDDCLVPWTVDLIQSDHIASCPYCRQSFLLPYECLGKAELETPELQDNANE